MKILVVDDNSANRMTIKWVLSKFDDLVVEEAEDGREAVDKARNEHFDLIFMDVMMPGMTGIEATKEIKQFSQKSMIIAVTALDDDETTKEMFRAGAEDYITKPLKQDIFKARLQNYFKIIENRNFYSLSINTVNLFSEPIFNRMSIFKIRLESNLAEFWEFYLYEGNNFGNEQLCDVISKIYNIGSLLLKMNIRFSIFCEENETHLFFSLNKTKNLNANVVEEIVRKDGFRGRFMISNDRVSFSSTKVKTEEHSADKTPIITEAIQVKSIPAFDELSEESKDIVSNVDIEDMMMRSHSYMPYAHKEEPEEEVLQVYDFIDEQDFIDLEEYIKDLDSVLMLIQSSELDSNDVANIAHKIEKISSILSTYNETYELGVSLRSLSFDIKDNTEAFIGNCGRLASMFFSFTRDLMDWFAKMFRTGAPSVSFMDATIIANAVMISTTVKPQDSNDSFELDDIFF